MSKQAPVVANTLLELDLAESFRYVVSLFSLRHDLFDLSLEECELASYKLRICLRIDFG